MLGAVQLIVGVLGVELFLSRTSFRDCADWRRLAAGRRLDTQEAGVPLFLLFFMVPIDAVIYNQITFPLQLLASRLADGALTLIAIPVLAKATYSNCPTSGSLWWKRAAVSGRCSR